MALLPSECVLLHTGGGLGAFLWIRHLADGSDRRWATTAVRTDAIVTVTGGLSYETNALGAVCFGVGPDATKIAYLYPSVDFASEVADRVMTALSHM